MRDWRNEIRSAIAVLKLEPTRETELVEELNHHLEDRSETMLACGQNAQRWTKP